MSTFLSKIHFQLYEKIKYQEHLNDILSKLLLQKDVNIDSFEDIVLPKGNLEDVIDHEQIHGWLQMQIKMVEHRYSLLLDRVQEAKLDNSAMNVLRQEGTHASKNLAMQNTLEAFQHLQIYLLNGMPCDRGITLLQKDEHMLVFQCNLNVHETITDIAFYMKLRLAWIQGFLQSENMNASLINQDSIAIIKEK